MPFHLLNLCLILMPLVALPWVSGEPPQPYCYKNITEVSYKVITKSRLINVSSKNILKKITFRKDTQMEVYEEQEPFYKTKLERLCCEGYKMSDLNLCEPQCTQNGCPLHSKCVEPEVCKCLPGYFSVRSSKNGKHHCEPICEKPCPEHSVCVGPNECACKKGYEFQKDDFECKIYCAPPNNCSCLESHMSSIGFCLPICSLGDQCKNGKCIAKDECVCNPDFVWNNETLKCDSDHLDVSTYSSTEMTVETDIETSNDDVDANQVFGEDISSSPYNETDDYASSTFSPERDPFNCPQDYVFHMGECRPLKFVSDETDCWLKPCKDQNAICLDTGICACREGFHWFKTPNKNPNSTETSTTECLLAEDYKKRLENLIQSPKESSERPLMGIKSLIFIILGSSVMLVALTLLIFKLCMRRIGKMDDQGKHMTCEYHSRSDHEVL